MLKSLAAFVAVCSFAVITHAAEGPAATDPKDAGPDFKVQGEYVGSIKVDGRDTKVGCQVVALGDSKFDAVFYFGGLPGDGWKRGDKQVRGTGKTQGSTTVLKGENGGTGEIADGKMTIKHSSDDVVGTLEKVERKSATIGAKPPAGAVVLFDGSGVEHFPGAKMTEDKLLKAGAMGKDEFKDFTLHLEFRTPFMPEARGQGRGNSGMYLQNRYEVQVLDSFGLEGENNECGGIYTVAKPIVNMCYPPLAWQTYDVEMTGARFEGDKKVKDARVTIKHNGVVIHDAYDIPKLCPGGAPSEAPGKGPLALQDHGNPVMFRNIWVVEKK
jgi:hypothetical protein